MVQQGMEEKRSYNVYKRILQDDGYGKVTEQKKFIGDTYAVSQSKAISNVRYRLYGRKNNRSYNDLGGDSSSTVTFIAEPA